MAHGATSVCCWSNKSIKYIFVFSFGFKVIKPLRDFGDTLHLYLTITVQWLLLFACEDKYINALQDTVYFN